MLAVTPESIDDHFIQEHGTMEPQVSGANSIE